VKGFTSKYKLDRLVYYEQFSDPISAITREKEIKAWRREKENNLVRKLNPKWEDLAKKIIWRKCLTAPLVIPNRADGEGPHQSGWRTKTILCDPIPWARSLACARDDHYTRLPECSCRSLKVSGFEARKGLEEAEVSFVSA